MGLYPNTSADYFTQNSGAIGAVDNLNVENLGFYYYPELITANAASVPYSLLAEGATYVANNTGDQVDKLTGWIWQSSLVEASTATIYLYQSQ